MSPDAYEMVVGLEVHVELKTSTKIFCGCRTDFDAPPNTQCCPVCMGLPGALPVLNEKVVEYAAKAGLATHCRIAQDARMDRKNYFYPDLPKAYQISQFDHPLCEGGWLDIQTKAGTKRIGITRIHIEEDAGKLMHAGEETQVDLNRCGVPLIELVTEPDFRHAEETRAFLQKLRAILLCIDVSDCRMNEGSMRCDVNLSVRKYDAALGTRTEIKNLNSFAYAVRAIEAEYRRQVQMLEEGGEIVQETRRFDPKTGKTYGMRSKENADDYRYFPDPDLPPIHLAQAEIEAWRAALPELPDARAQRLQAEYGLTAYEADTICAQPALCAAFESVVSVVQEPSRLWSLLMGEVSRVMEDEETVPFAPGALAELSNLISAGIIHFGAAKAVLEQMLAGNSAPQAIVEALGLAQISDPQAIAGAVQQVLADNAALVQTYRGGKTKAKQALMGKVMAATKGRANPVLAAEILNNLLDEKKA